MNTIIADSANCAKVYGEPLVELPLDLYIPPNALEIFLDAFEGPLDLLLYLIRRQNLDVLNIPMLEVTRQYMQYVEAMREKQLELAADYLLMAALLIEIKSRMLLPRPVVNQDEELDPRAELVRRLLEYERMKLAAQQLDALPLAGRDFKLVQVWLDQGVEKRLPDVNPDELRQAWLGVAARARAQRHHRVTREELSVREHMSLILRRLQGGGFIEFEALFEASNGLPEVVVTFLALLELSRESLVEISQTEVFATIYVKLASAGRELE
ncbi:MAG: ScpA family protein [Sulfurimicrobium sp.]|jgi:segregation and condensation protein A|nr:ScpA family protein [Sulfurimicrobium sp.]